MWWHKHAYKASTRLNTVYLFQYMKRRIYKDSASKNTSRREVKIYKKLSMCRLAPIQPRDAKFQSFKVNKTVYEKTIKMMFTQNNFKHDGF